MSDSVLLEIYRRLYQRYGPQRWWPGESSFEVILGAILTQAAAWANVEDGPFQPQGCRLLFP